MSMTARPVRRPFALAAAVGMTLLLGGTAALAGDLVFAQAAGTNLGTPQTQPQPGGGVSSGGGAPTSAAPSGGTPSGRGAPAAGSAAPTRGGDASNSTLTPGGAIRPGTTAPGGTGGSAN
jgi:hypothetical protein